MDATNSTERRIESFYNNNNRLSTSAVRSTIDDSIQEQKKEELSNSPRLQVSRNELNV
jgi:hypothetical protein